jgi:hypothetical protein
MNTASLELQSLQLDVKNLQKDNREDDRKEIREFSQQVQANLITMQDNFTSIQSHLTKLQTAADEDRVAESPPDGLASGHGQGSSVPHTPLGQPVHGLNTALHVCTSTYATTPYLGANCKPGICGCTPRNIFGNLLTF